MESFIACAQQLTDGSHGDDAKMDFGDLDRALSAAAASPEQVKEVLYALVDVYGAKEDIVYRQTIMEGIGRALCFVAQTQRQGGSTLALEDHLMLAMFFNELSTVADPTLLCMFASALAAFYTLAAPAAYEAKGTVKDKDEEEARASIRSELVALRQVMTKRLGAPAAAALANASGGGADANPRVHAASRVALDCLACMLRSQLGVLCAQIGADPSRISEEVKETVEGLMTPLLTVLEEQQHHQQRHPTQPQGGQSGSSFARELGKGKVAPTIPASLLTSVLACAEEVLWCAEEHCDALSASPAAAAAASVFRHAVSTLLGHLQRYLTLQQHRQTELAATGAAADGAASAALGRGEAFVDVMRSYSVQHAVQRVLSVATAAASASAGRHGRAKEKEKEGEAGRLLTATLSNGLQAALAAFGGPVAVRAPQWRRPETLGEPGEWTPASEKPRVHPCGNTLPTSSAGAADGGGEFPVDAADGEEEGAAYFEEEEEGLTLGVSREPLLKSSVGPVTAATLADIVMLSVAALDRAMVNKDNLRVVHLQGLEEMQYHAARRAQLAEIEHQRMIERQGVEAIPAVALLDHVRDSTNIKARGLATLRRVTARAVLEKASFSSVLRSYAFMKEESEATVRAAQALISRCLVQLPSSMADAALDEVFVQLQSEFKQEQGLRQASHGKAPPNSPVAQVHSYYQLMLQVLFSFAAAQAPIHERGEVHPLLLYSDGLGVGGPHRHGAAAVNAHVVSRVSFTVDTENPIAFLQEENTRIPSYLTNAAVSGGVGASRGGRRRRLGGGRGRGSRHRKWPRREEGDGDARNESDDEGRDSDGSSGNESGGGDNALDDDDNDDDDGGYNEDDAEGTQLYFLNDTARSPSAYSHVLCRLMELAESCKLEVILLDILLQAPTLPRYVWNHIYRRFCLSTANQERCNVGFLLLSGLASRRAVYRTCAVNLLLHLCLSKNDYARRVAIISVGRLLSTTTRDGRPVVPAEVEAALVRYAKKQLAAVPGYHFTTVLRATREVGSTALDEATIAALQAEEDKKALEVLGRHLGLFLKLCARQPRALFATLLDVYKQCVERNNEVMVRLLPTNKDVQAMTELLLASDPAGFMFTVLPFLRRYSVDACCFVHSLLWAISNKLRSLAKAAPGEGTATGDEHDALYYRTVAVGMLEHARAMYDMSRVPLGTRGRRRGGAEDEDEMGEDGHMDHGVHGDGEEEEGFILHDARFLAPFFSLLPTAELKQQYLPSFLYFVQVQLQLQRLYKQQQQQQGQGQGQEQGQGSGTHSSHPYGPGGGPGNGSLAISLLSAKERSYVLTHEELKQFIAMVVREVLVKAPFKFTDGVARGLSPVELFVYLHRAPQECLHATQNLDDGPSGAAATPPIGIVTTKEVISVCLELTRSFTFDAATTGIPKLYGPEEVERAIKKLVHPPPVPSQLMATVLQAVSAVYPRGTRYAVVKEFLHFVVVNVLTPLERASAWETDPQLWKGVQLFMEKFYGECGAFVVNLPDQVLLQALREHPRLAEKFREEHGNNASFGHILSNV